MLFKWTSGGAVSARRSYEGGEICPSESASMMCCGGWNGWMPLVIVATVGVESASAGGAARGWLAGDSDGRCHILSRRESLGPSAGPSRTRHSSSGSVGVQPWAMNPRPVISTR